MKILLGIIGVLFFVVNANAAAINSVTVTDDVPVVLPIGAHIIGYHLQVKPVPGDTCRGVLRDGNGNALDRCVAQEHTTCPVVMFPQKHTLTAASLVMDGHSRDFGDDTKDPCQVSAVIWFVVE